MKSAQVFKKIKYVRLDATISPIHKKKIQEEIHEAALGGRKVTVSDIIREELDSRYFLTRKNPDSKQVVQ
jgi:hypothetical protein